MRKTRFKKQDELLKVKDPQVGQLYHLSWAPRGCVWKLMELFGEYCGLETPKTKKKLVAKTMDLRHTRKSQLKEEQ